MTQADSVSLLKTVIHCCRGSRSTWLPTTVHSISVALLTKEGSKVSCGLVMLVMVISELSGLCQLGRGKNVIPVMVISELSGLC